MVPTDDTIVAIATPPGRGAIGVVRLSGPDAHRIGCELLGRTAPLRPRMATFGRVRGPRGQGDHAIDEAVATYFRAPRSFTAEDVVEIATHGSPVVQELVVAAALRAGARAARAGEFTFRAFINGRIDLTTAEAVRDVIEAVTPRQARAAFEQLEGRLASFIAAVDARVFDIAARLEASLDFPDEGYHFAEPAAIAGEIDSVIGEVSGVLRSADAGRVLREGAMVVIAGRPNTGKSSLFNALCGTDRVIVSPHAGTTRDLVSESIELRGVPVRLVDTAGQRLVAGGEVEAEGVRRAVRARDAAAVVLLVLDRSEPITEDDRAVIESAAAFRTIVALNKCDRPPMWMPQDLATTAPPVETSAISGAGVERLRTLLADAVSAPEAADDGPRVSNARHIELLRRAQAALERARALAADGAPEELVLVEIGDARAALESLVGRRAPDDLLAHIFERFCIGK